MAAPADSTLQAIYTKIRQLTRSPSESMLSTPDMDQQINTFVLYDFPEHLRLFALKTTFSFFTQPNIDTYAPSNDINDPLYHFNQIYVSFEPPVYIAGYEVSYAQSREDFYRAFPIVNSISNTQLFGDGLTTVFNGFLQQIPVLTKQVVFTAKDINNVGLVLYDDGLGNLLSPQGVLGQFYGSINYLTGQFNLQFPSAPAAQQPIISETYPYTPGRPTMMLYYDTIFTLRPVPDIAYKVTLNAYIRPTQLLEFNKSPQLEQWWQYIAYGAAKKIFENRMDLESVSLIMPEFDKQQRLVLRTTLVQQSNQRVPTIYTVNTQTSGFNPYGNNW
jgi:hypothetical protein